MAIPAGSRKRVILLNIQHFHSVMEGFVETGKALGLEGIELKAFVEKNEAERLEREEKKEKEK